MADLKLPRKKTVLPWLKRLLDDDDSSDASSQLSDSSSNKERQPEVEGNGTILKKRRRGSDSSDEEASEIPKAPRKRSDERRRKVRRGLSSSRGTMESRRGSFESSDSDDAEEKQVRRRLKKSPKAGNSVRHKHLHSHSVGSSRSAKHERSRSSKTTKTPVDEAKSNAATSREKRMRKLRASRISTGEHGRMAAFKLKRLQSAEALKLKERERARVHKAARGAHTTSAGAEADVEDEGESRSSPFQSDSRVKLAAKCEVRTTADPEIKVKEEAHADAVEMATGSTKVGAEQVESRAGTKFKAVGAVKQEGESQISVTLSTVSSDASSAPVKVEHDEERSTETTRDTSTESAKSEGALHEACSSPGRGENGEVGQVTPIPRKPKGEPSATSSAADFVIPKRKFPITGVAVTKEVSRAGRAGDRSVVGRVRRPLDPPVRVAMPPLPSPESSPMVTKSEPARSQKKRTKNVVPVKSSVVSPQDRALMRLSRKRNSIFMAAAELAAHVPEAGCHKKPSTRMMGYEVFDADGQTLLPDLIARLSCATKGEMGSNQESYPASFFGVSLSTPTAKGKAAGPNDCENSEQNVRKICCYEELRFKRPDDREFYQKKMYGTTFVPQMLRGWITLIIRNARFERKSTGFRFNQGRDREEFAASLSKRYIINKSVPRCDIPRENWQKIMRNQPGVVYLHYYNREDAECASRVFRDDLGQQFQLKVDYKAGVVMRRSTSPAVGPQRSPRGSYASDSGAPEPSPLSSQNESAHSTPSWRRERQPASRNDLRFSRFDRGATPPPARWPREEGRYGPSVSGSRRPRALLERRSRSRSRSKTFHRLKF